MIYAIGDSFTAGAELDSNEEAWPQQLSSLLNKKIINLGKEGTGNERIIKRTIDAVIKGASLVIIGWSSPSRIELADENGVFNIWPAKIYEREERKDLIKFITINDVPKYSYAGWIRQIILIQHFCKLKNVRCLMFSSFGTDKLHKKYSEEFKSLVDEIDLTMFIGYTMNETTCEWTFGLPNKRNGHPGHQGHQIIANKIHEHIRNLGWVS